MDKWNLIIDVAKCENCRNCTLAVKDEHCDNDFPGYSAPQPRHGHEWIKIDRMVRGAGSMVDVSYLPTTCNQCDNAPCIKHAGDDSVVKREDGIVIIDPKLAKGRRDLVDACPYGAIWWNSELNLPQKWIFDAHLLDNGWDVPRCVQSCPTGAIQASKVSDDQMKKIVSEQGLEVLKPELNTKPRVYYKNLYRFAKCFVGGTVTATVNARKECIDKASVTLLALGNSGTQRQVLECQTDAFGDFKFDRVEPKKMSYQLDVSHPKFGRSSTVVQVDGVSCVVPIHLTPPS